MMFNQLNTPKLRFKEFSSLYTTNKLAHWCSVYSGGTPSAGDPKYYGGDIPFIRSGEIDKTKTKLFLTTEGLSNSSAKMVEVGDFLIALYGANSGIPAISKIRGAINQAVLCVKSEISSVYLKLLFEKMRPIIVAKYLQGGQGNLSGSLIKNLRVSLPEIQEQKKIAHFISTLDKKIGVLKEKQALLKLYKKGVMQKLLSQETRFKDEKGNDFPDWQEECFSNLLILQLNSLKMDDESEYELITVRRRNGGVDSRGIYKGKEVLVKNQFELKANQFVISKRQIVHGACGLVPEVLAGAIVSNEYNVFEPVPNKLDINYFNIIAKTVAMKRAFFINSDGVHIEKLLFKTQSWLKTKLDFPCVAEQQKIVSFIETFDKKLELVSQQIEQTQTFKKGLLQQMFV